MGFVKFTITARTAPTRFLPMLQDTSLDFKLVQRICLLQQALDQAMDSLADLQRRVEDHQMLESHLAQTEEYSNVQQKIIINLQQQLSAKSQWQQQILEKVLTQVKHLVNGQQIELERLRARIYQSQAELQTYLVRLKNQYQVSTHPAPASLDMQATSELMLARNLTVNLCGQLQTAQQHIHHLDNTLTRYQVMFAQMKVQAQAVGGTVDEEVAPSEGGTPEFESEWDLTDWETLRDPVALQAIADVQHQKITELSAELNKQFQYQTQLKQRCQLLAAERDCSKQNLTDLEQENARLREQLAQQHLENQHLQEQLAQQQWPDQPLEEPAESVPDRPDQAPPSQPGRQQFPPEQSLSKKGPRERLSLQLQQRRRNQGPAEAPIPHWRSHTQEPNPLFRFKPGLH